MPDANEHPARLQDPAGFKEIRREKEFAPGVDALWGIDDNDKASLQAIRFDSERFTEEQAKAWLKENDYQPIAFEPAEKKTDTTASLESVKRPVSITCGGGWRSVSMAESISGVPRQRAIKDIIAIGQYVKASEDLTFAVTQDTLDNWVLQFRRMKRNGVRVSLPTEHHTDGNPRSNNGWVDELWAADGKLWMSCTLIGEDAITAAARSDVSLRCPVELIDGKGKVYAYPIEHVALVTNPVVPAQGEFIALSLSDGKESVMFEDLKKLLAKFGLDPESVKDEAEALAKLGGAIDALLKDGKTEDKPTEKTEASLDKPADEVTAFHKATVAKLRASQVQQLTASGKCNKAAAEKLGALALSLSCDAAGEAQFEAVLATHEANTPPSTSGAPKTGAQVPVELSNPLTEKPPANPLLAAVEKRNEDFDQRQARVRR